MHRLLTFVLASLLLLGCFQAVQAAGFVKPESTRTGTIQELDFGHNSMVLDGNIYFAATDIKVEIRGSFGAFTMLQTGMKVEIIYRVISPSEREITEIRQLPDNTVLEGA